MSFLLTKYYHFICVGMGPVGNEIRRICRARNVQPTILVPPPTIEHDDHLGFPSIPWQIVFQIFVEAKGDGLPKFEFHCFHFIFWGRPVPNFDENFQPAVLVASPK